VLQQINLYQKSAATMARQVLSSSTVMIGGLLILVSLGGIAGFGAWEISRLSEGVELVRQHQQTQEDMLGKSPTTEASGQTPQQIEARNKLLRAELATRKRALQLLQDGAAGQPSGFAVRLEALARRHVEGVWLDRLVLGSEHGAMSLSGATLDADLVPRYLQNLASDPSLEGTRFDEFVIEQPEPQTEEEKKAAPRYEGLRFRAANNALAATLPVEPAT
jgi:hypothetical protein